MSQEKLSPENVKENETLKSEGNAECDTEPTGTSRVFLLNDDALNSEENIDIIELRHPSTGGPGMFLISANDTVIQEVQTFRDDLRSWFIDESVKSEGEFFLTTPIDPLFLALSYLVKVGRCMPLDQILTDDEFPQIHRLLNMLKPVSLCHIADLKGPESLNAWILNEEKTLSWLKAKTERVAETLKVKRIHVGPMAVSNTFVKSKEDTTENYLKYAHGIISEYLPEEISKKLSQVLGIPVETDLKRKKPQTNGSEAKRPKLEKCESTDRITSPDTDSSKNAKPAFTPKPTISSKEKARATAAKGSKSISSFFKKK